MITIGDILAESRFRWFSSRGSLGERVGSHSVITGPAKSLGGDWYDYDRRRADGVEVQVV